VLAVRVEGGEVDLKQAALGAAEIDRPLLTVMPNHEFAPFMSRGEHDDQRRNHSIELLAVAMRQEEAPRLIDQQVIEVALQLLLLQSQLLLDLDDRLLDEPFPIGIRQRETVRPHPPDAPDARVDDGLLALAVGSLFAVLHQFFRLLGGERQTDRPQLRNLQPGEHGGDTAADAERTRSIDFRQLEAKLISKVLPHGSLLALASVLTC
jgi:hypothetical protein